MKKIPEPKVIYTPEFVEIAKKIQHDLAGVKRRKRQRNRVRKALSKRP